MADRQRRTSRISRRFCAAVSPPRAGKMSRASPAFSKQLISHKSGRLILKTPARKFRGYHIQCPVQIKADVLMLIKMEKDQVWDGPVHKDELTQNNWCKFQLLQTVLKKIKLTKKYKICFGWSKSYQNRSQFKMCECHGFYLCCTSVRDHLVPPTCLKNSEISSTHCHPQKTRKHIFKSELSKSQTNGLRPKQCLHQSHSSMSWKPDGLILETSNYYESYWLKTDVSLGIPALYPFLSVNPAHNIVKRLPLPPQEGLKLWQIFNSMLPGMLIITLFLWIFNFLLGLMSLS